MQIKTLLIFILVSTSLISVKVDAQNWYWARQADSAQEYAGYDAVDRNGNPCYTGYFDGTRVSFGSIGGLTNLGSQSDFLVKYTTNGNPLWARNATALSSSALTYGMSVATDRNNNVIEAGYYSDSIAFGSTHLSAGTAFESGYVVKYDANGNVLWAESPSFLSTSSSDVYAYSVAADLSNNIFVTGYFQGIAIFGTDTLTSGELDMFLVKYDPNGNVLWAKAPVLKNPSSLVYGTSVAIDDSGNAYIGGTFQDTAIFGTVQIVTPPPVALNVYMAKFDPSGNVKWAEDIPATPGQFLPTPVSVDKTGNVYIASQFTNTSLTIGLSTITDGAPPCSNSMLAKYDHNGNPLWATCADYISSDEVCVIVVSSIATDRCNNVYWSGICSDTFGVGNVKITVPYGASNPSVAFTFVIKIDSAGNPIAGAGLADQSSQSFSNGIAIDSLSRVYFDAGLTAPARMIVGSDTVYRYLTDITSFISKFSIIPSVHSNGHDSICLGDSLVLSFASATGLTYLWNTGATTDSIIVKPTTTTTYYVIINNTCNIDTSFVRVVVSSVNPLITGIDSICRGDTVLLVGSGGLTYRWNTSQTTDSIKVAPTVTTTYTLAVSTLGCSKDTTFTVFIKPSPVAGIIPTPSDSVCRGDSVLLTGSGGTTFLWNTGATSSSIWVNPLISSTYTLHVTAGSCPDSTTLNITIVPPTVASVNALPDSICPLETATLTATGSGGQITYKWNTGATTSTIQVNPSVTSTYSVNVFGRCDTVKDTVTVTVVPLAKPLISGKPTRCSGEQDTLTISGGITYVWSNGSTATTYITGAINADSTISVTAYNSLGCSDTAQFKIIVAPSPTVTVSYANACLNSPVVVHANASGTGPFSYVWSPGGQTTDSITLTDSAQTGSVVVSNGCKAIKSFTITPYIPSLYACCNKTIFIGDDTIIVAGGVTSYQWSPTITCLNPPLCDSVKVSPTVTTTYTVTGTDSLGCYTEKIITITVEVSCLNFSVPNVFTPNYAGPYGMNNLLYIKTDNVNSWAMKVFDRWGREMYNSTNVNEYWSGNTESGDKAPDGVYYYVITATCQSTTYKKEGFIQLIR